MGSAITLVLFFAASTMAWSAPVGADTQPSHFIWTSPTGGNYTLINNGATNGNPNALLFVTPNAEPNGVCGCTTETTPIGVFYDTTASQWAIFYEVKGLAVQAGISFNVLVFPNATSNAFKVTSSPSNIIGDTVFIDNTLTNGQPSATLQVTQVGLPGAGPSAYHDQVPGVWYYGSSWGVFNESEHAMASGESFNVLVGSGGGGKVKTLIANNSNRASDGVEFNNATTNGDSNAFALDTPNYDPNDVGGTIDTSLTNVMYGGSVLNVVNGDGSTMANHEAFNLIFWNS